MDMSFKNVVRPEKEFEELGCIIAAKLQTPVGVLILPFLPSSAKAPPYVAEFGWLVLL